MELLDKNTFTCNGKHYDLRVYKDNHILSVVVFHNNHPANCYRHHIHIPKTVDPAQVLISDVFQETVAQAKQDIIDTRWERLLHSIT